MRPSAAFWPADRPELTHAVINPTSHRPRGRASPPGSKTRHHSGSRQQLPTSAAKNAELVTFWVCQYDPRLFTLTNINTLCAMGYQTSHLSVLVIRSEVEMQSALSLLALIKPDEVQPRQAIRLRADLELLSRRVDHHPTKSLGPPLPQAHRVDRVNNHLFPFQGHPPNLDRPGLQEQAFRSEKTLVTDYVTSPRCHRLRTAPTTSPMPVRRDEQGGPGTSDRNNDSGRRGGRSSLLAGYEERIGYPINASERDTTALRVWRGTPTDREQQEIAHRLQ